MTILYCIIAYFLGSIATFTIFALSAMIKEKKPQNKVHFYVTRDDCGTLELWFGFPRKTQKYYLSHRPTTKLLEHGDSIREFGLNLSDYDKLRFNDDPVEVFLNLED